MAYNNNSQQQPFGNRNSSRPRFWDAQRPNPGNSKPWDFLKSNPGNHKTWDAFREHPAKDATPPHGGKHHSEGHHGEGLQGAAHYTADLGTSLEAQYNHYKAAADRVLEKHPEHAEMYNTYLQIYRNKASELSGTIIRSDGQPVDPRFIKEKIAEAERDVAKQMDAQYPIFTAANASPEEKAAAAENKKALQRLSTEINGESFITSVTKSVYDEEKGGMQWSSIAGLAGGFFLGGWMGKFMADAAGIEAGWMGTAAMALLAVAGAAMGSKLASQLMNPAPSATGGYAPEKTAPAHGKTKEVDGAGTEVEQTTEEKTSSLEKAQAAARNVAQSSPIIPAQMDSDMPTAPALAGVAAKQKAAPENPFNPKANASLQA